jgi:hypothetical protein
LVDTERRLHARFDAGTAQCVLQREGVHQRGQHSHVIGGGAVHARRPRRHATEDVAAADDHRRFDAEPHHLRDLGHDAVDHLAVDAVRILAHQRLAGQLEQDAPVRRRDGTRRGQRGDGRNGGDGGDSGFDGHGDELRSVGGATVRGIGRYAFAIAATSAAKSSLRFSMPSPTT